MGSFYFVITLTAMIGCSAAITTVGKDFVLIYLVNEVDFPRNIPMSLYIANSKYSGAATATISIPSPPSGCIRSQTVTVNGGAVVKVVLCSLLKWNYLDPEVGVVSKVVTVNASSAVSVWGMNEETQSAGAFLAYPITTWGTYYYVVTYLSTVDNAEFGIVSNSDHTVVTVTLPTVQTSSVPLENSFRCLRHDAGSSYSFSMQQQEVYVARCTRDLTGTKILASKAIAVFAGNVRAGVSGEKARDHMVEQLVSVGSWDTAYVYVPTPPRSGGGPDYVRVVASVAGTTVWATSSSGMLTFQLDAGMFYEMSVQSVMYINATSPIYVAIVTGDQALINIPGLSQFTNDYYAPVYGNTFAGSGYANTYLMVVTSNDTLYNLRLNRDTFELQTVQWQAVPGLSNMIAGVITLPSSVTAISLENLNPSVKLGAWHYGTGSLQAFGTTLALDLPKQCEFSVQTIGDGIDNDCNGKVDDQVCTPTSIPVDCGYFPASTVGRDFLIVFETNLVDDSPNALPYATLLVTPQQFVSSTRLSLTSPLYTSGANSLSQNFTVIPKAVLQINIPSYYLLSTDTIDTSRALRVTSTQDISVVGLNRITGSTDSFLAFPTQALGYDYYVVTYFPGDDQCQFAVIAAEAGITQLQITMPNPSGVAISVQLGSGNMCTNNQVCTAQLAQFQTLQVQSPADLTGARVVSTSGTKIAVYTGNLRARVSTAASKSRDHLVDQAPPLPTWGREYVIIATPRFDGFGDYIRVVASRPNTHFFVDFNGTAQGVEYVIATAGGYMQLDIPNLVSVRITSVNPILVAQLVKSALVTGDPSLTIVPAVEQWLNSYKFSVFSTAVLGTLYTNYMTIAIATQYIPGLLFSGQALSTVYPNTNWTAIPGTRFSTAYFVLSYSSPSQSVSHATASVTFEVLQYGAGDRESYAQPVGTNALVLGCQPNVNYMVPGDNVDNDCDTFVDEESCNNYDDDLDGLIDEDCGPVVTVTQGVTPTYRYWITFMQNDAEVYRGYGLEVYVASLVDGNTVRIRTPVPLINKRCDAVVNLNANTVQKFDVSDLYRLSGLGVTSYRAVLVETSTQSIVYAVNKETYTAGGFDVLREDRLGTSYYAVNARSLNLYSQFAVIATADQTLVTFKLPVCSVNLQPCTASFVTFRNSNYSAGDSFSVTLNRFQVIQIQSLGDLTGTSIISTKSVAVFSGNDRTAVGSPSPSRDHLVEQLPPTSSWGVDHNVVSMPGRSSGDVYRIVASTNGTNVFWWDQMYALNAGDAVELQMSSKNATRVYSNYPIMIAQISKSADWTSTMKYGDPSMLIIPPLSCYTSDAVFALPSAANDVQYDHFLVLVVSGPDLTRINMNGQHLSETLSWSLVAGSNQYWTTTVPLSASASNGNSAVALLDPTGTGFYAFVTGSSDRESYSFNVGAYF